MSKRLETQLEELKTLLHQREELFAAAKRENATAIKAAEKACEDAETQTEKASHACDTLRESLETENKIAIYKHTKDEDGDAIVESELHPDFINRVAALVGVHFKDRYKVDPKNQHDSLYTTALQALRRRLIDEHPAVVKLDKIYSAVNRVAGDARSALWAAKRPVQTAEQLVIRTKHDIIQLEQRIKDRNFEKQVLPAERKDIEEHNEAAKAARLKLRQIVEGTLTVPLKPEK